MYNSWYLLTCFSMLFDIRQEIFFLKIVCWDWNWSTYPKCVMLMLNKNSFLSASYFDSTVFAFIVIVILWYIMLLSIYLSRRRQWQATPVLLPRKSHGWRGLVGCSPWGRYKSHATERLHFHFSLSHNGEGNGGPLQCSCLENPRDCRAWWAAIYGVAQSQTWLKWLSSIIIISSILEINEEIKVKGCSVSCPGLYKQVFNFELWLSGSRFCVFQPLYSSVHGYLL